MSGETPPVPPFAMVGDAEAPVCVDGVCDLPAPEGDDQTPPGSAPS